MNSATPNSLNQLISWQDGGKKRFFGTLSEPVTATLMTNIIALHKDKPPSPARSCKFCAANYFDYKCAYCNWKEAV